MCGIDGFFGSRDIDTTSYYRAHLLLKHRGPDDEGFIANPGGGVTRFRGDDSDITYSGLSHVEELASASVVLGHRRLSIIDLSSQGHQPFVDNSGRFALVYNGEIFNYLELRSELARLGHQFETDSDTEVFLKSYIEWGEACFERFNGMWAAAIWDIRGHRIVLSRDHFGIKPLYYCVVDGTLYFASEMRFLLDFAGLSRVMNQGIAADYLYRNLLSHGEQTFYQGILELEPAHYLQFGGSGELNVRKYWDFEPEVTRWNDADAVERFGELFTDSLRLRMRSDVEAGSLLSGGLDSSLIVCALKSLGLVSSDLGFNTFSGVFADERFSERRYIEEVAFATGVATHFSSPDAADLDLIVDTLLGRLEEPCRSLAPALQLSIYEQVDAETRVKVLLNGQGADEMFGGYTGHFYLRFAELVSRGKWAAALDEARQFRSHRGVNWLRIRRTTLARIRQYRGGRDLFNKATFPEVTRSPLPEYLKYDDRTSMTFGLEARPPFLDRRLVEFAFGLPSEMKIRGISSKWVEREYAKPVVPRAIVARTDKMGFVTPQESWQRAEMRPALAKLADNLDRVLSVGAEGEVAPGRERFLGYLRDENQDWPFAWRALCLSRWMDAL